MSDLSVSERISGAVSQQWATAKKFGEIMGLGPRDARTALAKMKQDDPARAEQILAGNNEAIKTEEGVKIKKRPHRAKRKEKTFTKDENAKIDQMTDALVIQTADPKHVRSAILFITKVGGIKEAKIAIEAAAATMKQAVLR